MNTRVKTGILGLDSAIDALRIGDNVVWQVDTLSSYQRVVDAFVSQALSDKRKLVYVRFGAHQPLIDDSKHIIIYEIDAGKGFESFATDVYRMIEKEGTETFYVFDVLTELLNSWYSDLMIGNFFHVTCPFLYELDTVAYFGLIRNAHTFTTIATIRETTQLLLDAYQVEDQFYIHPLKVWKRYSPTMFFPHNVVGEQVVPITSSAEASAIFSTIRFGEERLDYWDMIFNAAREKLNADETIKNALRDDLMLKIIGQDSRMIKLCQRYMTLEDILLIQARTIGTGYIGGKSVGMLLARKIIEKECKKDVSDQLESHDSFYLGSDVFYTYIVQNGWWQLRTQQKTDEFYYTYGKELKEKLKHGEFPDNIKEKFIQLLEYFGQSPIIVRSSSLQEDNFGNAFAGKYESVFCANQGTEDERYEEFVDAIRKVYASAMNESALVYRKNRGLFSEDEQMAILIQRVSGDFHGDYFFPHAAGVGHSTNLYVWNQDIDIHAGMLRIVFGLGTRAVDRIEGDYAKIVSLDHPEKTSPMNYEDEKKYSQHYVDLLSVKDNKLTTLPMEKIQSIDLKTESKLFFRIDGEARRRIRESGLKGIDTPYILDLKRMINTTEFPTAMRHMMTTIEKIYDYPVDIEFTVNFTREEKYKINIVQCRPLQTKIIGEPVAMPDKVEATSCLIQSKGNFMGGNVHLPIQWVIFVDPVEYLALSQQDKYASGKIIGKLNAELKDDVVMLMGPGRWGTTTPSLGVPVKFHDICHMNVLCEMALSGFMPELSYGSHFFQDIVESDVFYCAIFEGMKDVDINLAILSEKENQISRRISVDSSWENVIRLVEFESLELYSDIQSQRLICCKKNN
jgi:hypothetical protein